MGSDGDLAVVEALSRASGDNLALSTDGDFSINLTTMYRYHSSGGNYGGAHQMKMVLGPRSAAKLMADRSLTAAQVLQKSDSEDLGDGDQAEMLVELKHKTSRLVQDATRKFLKLPAGKVEVSVDGRKETKVEVALDAKTPAPADVKVETKLVGEVDIDWEHADFTTATDIMIVNQVKSWSFGLVNQEVLDGIPERKRDVLASKCDELYKGALFPFFGSGGKN